MGSTSHDARTGVQAVRAGMRARWSCPNQHVQRAVVKRPFSSHSNATSFARPLRLCPVPAPRTLLSRLLLWLCEHGSPVLRAFSMRVVLCARRWFVLGGLMRWLPQKWSGVM